MRPVGLVLALSDAGLDELFEARKLVEPGLAALAAERIDDADGGGAAALRARPRADALDDAEAFMWTRHRAARADRARGRRTRCSSRLLDSIAGMGIASRRRTGRLAPVREQSAHDHRGDRRGHRGARRGGGLAPRCCAIWRTSNGR